MHEGSVEMNGSGNVDKVSFLPADHGTTAPPAGITVEKFTAEVARWLGHREAVLTHSGRAAMSAVFAHLGLRCSDEVFITTTFGYPNVSSCVTSTIFNFCKPSRVLTDAARAIFVIHEFGVPHHGTPQWREEAWRRSIPLIEDCAHTIDSVAAEGWRVGNLADWVILSLPKLFPTLKGGLLVGPRIDYRPSHREILETSDAAAVAAAWWPLWPEHAQYRRKVYSSLTERFAQIGLRPLFEMHGGVTPWFFPVSTPVYESVLASCASHRIDCGWWHGTNIVVFPCHQFISDDHVNRIVKATSEAVEH